MDAKLMFCDAVWELDINIKFILGEPSKKKRVKRVTSGIKVGR